MSSEHDETAPGPVPGPGPDATGIRFRVGDVIAEKYRVERVLGVGGMGAVVAVTHLSLGEPYAIKYLTGRGARDPAAVARFLAEARAAVRIKSEHVVRVSDVGQLPNGSPYILMEQLTGRDLGEVLADHGPMTIETAVDYVLQASVGIAEAHALGIVHRDLKPSNLFLTQRLDGAPLVKVLDFGIAKALGDPTQSAVQTATDAVFGSPAYMSPEQIRSARNVDVRTDIWSLGVILHELLAGELPFKAETVGGLLAAVAADEPIDVRRRRPDVPAELAAVLLRCLEKNVAKRFQTVSELASALEPFKSPESLASVGRIRRLSRPAGALRHLSGYSRERIATARTHRTWETETEDARTADATAPADVHSAWTRPLAGLLAASLVAVVLVVVFALRVRQSHAAKPSAEEPAVAAASPPAEARPASSTAAAVDAPPAAPASSAPPPAEARPAASAPRATQALPRRAVPSPRPAPAPAASTTPAAVVPTTSPFPGATRDPAADSH